MTSLVDERGFNQGYTLTPAQKIRLARRAEAIRAEMALPLSRTASFLELGCGTGELAHMLAEIPQADVLGVDLSPSFVRQAEARYAGANLRFATADIVGGLDSFPDESWDFIVGNGVLHHVYADLDRVLSNLKRILRPGGKLIFWEPNCLNPYIYLIFTFAPLRRLAQLEPAEMAFAPGFVRKKLQALGMAKTTIATRDFLLPNTPAPLIGAFVILSRALERIPVIRTCAQSLFIVSVKPAHGNE